MYLIGTQIWGPSTGGAATRIPFGLYLKQGDKVRAEEGLATKFVASFTTLPVPTVVDIVEFHGKVLIILTALPGARLADSILDLSEEQCTYIAHQLSDYLGQMRRIPPPDGSVCGFLGTPVRCPRISFSEWEYGPWLSINDFHSFLLEHSVVEPPVEVAESVSSCISEAHARKHRVCFAHADFHPGNILVDEHYTITGILDWELAGWYPEYWEYTKARYPLWSRGGNWRKIMTAVFPQYDLEYKAEEMIWKYRRIYV